MSQREEDIAWERLEAMTLEELAREFDERCDRARRLGLWLFEREPDFAYFCVRRFARLVRLGSGEHRK